jgi:tRNA dimethylallyltransferase
MRVLAIFGPTAVGKTGVALAVAERLRAHGEDPVAVSCDSIQVYRGLEALSGAASAGQRAWLEHRLVGFVPVAEEFSAGRFAALAQAEIDALLAAGRRPIVVGGTGLYLRAALAELELRPAVPAEVRSAVEAELDRRGSAALHAELAPELAAVVHRHDRKRVARLTELARFGVAPHADSEGLWADRLRHPTLLVGLTAAREELDRRIDARIDVMLAAGCEAEVRAADAAGASRTARAAIGFEALLAGDVEAMRSAQRRFARRQLTWMRRMPGVSVLDRTGRPDAEVAEDVMAALSGENASGEREP